jgi:hypothetical protein
MFDETGLQVMELAGKGYCCSQILVLLALDEMGRENPDLVRAATGLCKGLGDCSGPCGVYTGAALLLGLHGGKGTDMEEGDDKLSLMLEALHVWFFAITEQYGGTTCGDILDGECGQPDQSRCGGLMAGAFAQVREILADNGFDPSRGRGEE